MRVPARRAAALARLLAWDAPFLPAVTAVAADDGLVTIECERSGASLAEVAGWARGRRLAIATQVVAAAEFLFERGWFAGRSLLRGVRVERRAAGDQVRLSEPPRWPLDDPRLGRRLRRLADGGDGVRAAALAPLLRALVPERWAALEEAILRRPQWALAEELVSVLTGDGRTASALRHPGGPGRALWARRLPAPEGVAWVEDDDALATATAAARVAAAASGRPTVVCSGPLDETEVARALARAAADGCDAVVLTTVPVAGTPPIAVSGGEAGAWVLGPAPRAARQHQVHAVEHSGGRATVVADLLRRGAATAFTAPPEADDGRPLTEQLASPSARTALRWLRQLPVGLEAAELAALQGGDAAAALLELERLRLVARHGRRWSVLSPADPPDPARLAAIATDLPARSWAACAAAGLDGGDWRRLEARCEEDLECGDGGGVLAAAGALAGTDALALAGAEAALLVGRLADTERLLEAVVPDARGDRWHALAAWWAEQAGLPARARTEMELAEIAALPPRLAARVRMVAAELARRGGDSDAECGHLADAVALAAGSMPEARLLLAVARGGAALRRLGREEWARWPADVRARALHLLGYAAMSRGALAAAGTAMRAALRAASGANPRVLGDLHSDLGTVAVMAGQTAAAERHLQLAERFLERCGSRRAVTVVRHNRGVLANDRLDWRAAEVLVRASRDLRGGVVDSAYWFEELELARARLARGEVAAVTSLLPALRAGLAGQAQHGVLQEALAALGGHLALAQGDVAGAEAQAAAADDGERALLVAVVRANGAIDPDPALPQRWGAALTARALARWRRGDQDGAREVLADALARGPREAAVAFVRLAALLAAAGERPGAAWLELRRRCDDALAEADLDGWSAHLRGLLGLDVELLLDAFAGIAAGGPAAIDRAALATIARAVGASAIELRRHGELLAGCGSASEWDLVVHSGEVRVLLAGAPAAAAREAAELLAALAGAAAAPRAETVVTEAGSIRGAAAAVAALRGEVARWAPLPATVLVLGEPGTGKELVARELHRASGRKGKFVAVNCAGIPATLLEAELFGVVKGAYTGADRDRQGMVEEAERGTLFLDEIGELPFELQAKLLRLLQDREVRRVGAASSRSVDVRFVAATNRDLKAAAAAGQFRPDLYYRLSVGVIEIPPLRARREDIDDLARHFLAHYAVAFGRPGVRLAPAALATLRAGQWPGNVRELDSAIARAVATAQPGDVIGADRFAGVEPALGGETPLLVWTAAVEAFRRRYFADMLRATGGNRSEAARRAGLSRQALLYHLRHLGRLE